MPEGFKQHSDAQNRAHAAEAAHVLAGIRTQESVTALETAFMKGLEKLEEAAYNGTPDRPRIAALFARLVAVERELQKLKTESPDAFAYAPRDPQTKERMEKLQAYIQELMRARN